MSIEKIIIMGSGPAGLTAGIYTARANLDPLIIEGSNPGGQLMGTTVVENWPGEQSILGPQLVQTIRQHAQHFGCRFVMTEVTKADLSKQPFTLWTKDQELQAHALILACGAVPKKLGCPGEEEYWGKGVTTCAICDGAFYPDKPVIVVGGGDTAMEDALFLSKFTKKVTIVHILDALTASHAMRERVLAQKHITIVYNSTVTEIRGNGAHVTGVTITNQKTHESTPLPAQGVFIAIGLVPRTELFKGQLELDSYGYVVLKSPTTKTATSVPGVFAAGDIADFRYRQAITAAGAGCMAALDAERYLKDL